MPGELDKLKTIINKKLQKMGAGAGEVVVPLF
jgi:hypothetical protein